VARHKEVTDERILEIAKQCFIEHGAGISAADIAKPLGVSHTTIFNRFGSKEALMIAALGPSKKVPWVAMLDAGPDARPIQEQLIEHGEAMSAYFQNLQAGLSILQAAGISHKKIFGKVKGDSPPVQAFHALSGWLRRAQKQGWIADCDIETVASTILGVLHSRAFSACACGGAPEARKSKYVENFIKVLWGGIGVKRKAILKD